jgi:hypothetical protein
MGSALRPRFGEGGAAAVYLANPAGSPAALNGSRRSNQRENGRLWMSTGGGGGLSWRNVSVWRGAFGYSCLTDMPPQMQLPTERVGFRVGLMWETDGPECAVGTSQGQGNSVLASCRIVFSSFPQGLR